MELLENEGSHPNKKSRSVNQFLDLSTYSDMDTYFTEIKNQKQYCVKLARERFAPLLMT